MRKVKLAGFNFFYKEKEPSVLYSSIVANIDHLLFLSSIFVSKSSKTNFSSEWLELSQEDLDSLGKSSKEYSFFTKKDGVWFNSANIADWDSKEPLVGFANVVKECPAFLNNTFVMPIASSKEHLEEFIKYCSIKENVLNFFGDLSFFANSFYPKLDKQEILDLYVSFKKNFAKWQTRPHLDLSDQFAGFLSPVTKTSAFVAKINRLQQAIKAIKQEISKHASEGNGEKEKQAKATLKSFEADLETLSPDDVKPSAWLRNVHNSHKLNLNYIELRDKFNNPYVIDDLTKPEEIEKIQKVIANPLNEASIFAFSFETTEPFILTPIGGNDKKYLAGPWRVQVTKNGMTLLTTPHTIKARIASDIYKIHPHARSMDYPDTAKVFVAEACLGELSDRFFSSLKNCDLQSALISAISWLRSSYVGDAWGTSITKFPESTNANFSKAN